MGGIVDFSLTVEDNMPAHKSFQRPIYTTHMTHESSRALGLGVPGDSMTFQTSFIATLDHVGARVEAFRHAGTNGAAIDEMPLDPFMGKAVCFDLRHIPDLGEFTEAEMAATEKAAASKSMAISCCCAPVFISDIFLGWKACGGTRC